jgi:hypothetical protein
VEPEPPFEQRPSSLPLQLDLPAAMPVASAEPAAERDSIAARVRRRAVVLLVLGVGAVALVALLFVVILPWYVRRTCIDQAAAHGIVLAIDEVSIRGGGFLLQGVKATFTDVPDAAVEAPEVTVETRGLAPQKLSSSGLEIAISGRWSGIAAALGRWRASEQGGQGGAWAPASLILDGSRIVWKGALGDQASVEAAGVHLDVTWKGADPVMHATSSLVTLVVPAGTLGPWRVDLDREPGSSRARIALDPGVPDACTVLIVGDDATVNAVDANVPRSPLPRLGLAPALRGLHGAPQVEAHIHWVPFAANATATATAQGGVYGVTVDGIPQPLDITWDLKATGQGGAGDIKQGRLTVGPLVGDVRGTLKTYPDGFRVDAGWSAGPVPCAAFDPTLGPGEPLDFAYQIRKLAQSAGLTKLTGSVSASAMLAFDSRDLGGATMTFTPNATCDVAMGR